MNLNALIAGLIMSAPPVYIRPPPTVYTRPPAIAYSAPVQQQPRSEQAWRADIMRQARQFCSAYPANEACNRPDGPPAR